MIPNVTKTLKNENGAMPPKFLLFVLDVRGKDRHQYGVIIAKRSSFAEYTSLRFGGLPNGGGYIFQRSKQCEHL
jgi:hypothetical protein